MKRKHARVEAAEQGRDRKHAKSQGAVAPEDIARDANARGKQRSTAKPSAEKSDVARREAFNPRAAGVEGGEKAPTYRDTCRDCQVCVLLVGGLSMAHACAARISDAKYLIILEIDMRTRACVCTDITVRTQTDMSVNVCVTRAQPDLSVNVYADTHMRACTHVHRMGTCIARLISSAV